MYRLYVLTETYVLEVNSNKKVPLESELIVTYFVHVLNLIILYTFKKI